MQWVRSSAFVLLLLASAGFINNATAQRCVMGLDANGNPNGACQDWSSSSSDRDTYSDPSNGANTNFFQSMFQFPVRALAATVAAPFCGIYAVQGDSGRCFKRNIEGLANTFPPAKLVPQGTSFFGQTATPPNVQVNARTPTTATNPTPSAQAVSITRDSTTAALTPSNQNAWGQAGYGFDNNSSASSAPLSFGSVGPQLTPTVRWINAALTNDARYRADLQSHKAALAAAAKDRTTSAARLNALEAQIATDRNKIAGNQGDLYRYVQQPAVAQQVPPALQQQVKNVLRYQLD